MPDSFIDLIAIHMNIYNSGNVCSILYLENGNRLKLFLQSPFDSKKEMNIL